MITKERLKEDFSNIGISDGDTLFLRISYRAIGKIEGGPMVFLEALHEVVGENGTIILTAFPKKHIRQLRIFHRKEVYTYENPPKPDTGVMAVMAMSYPEAKWSRKLEFPFVVIGKYAEYLTNSHTHEKDAYWLLEEAIKRFDCKCLRVGGEGFTGSTHIAFTNVLKATGNYQKKPKYGLYIRENEVVKWYDAENTIFCRSAFLELNRKEIFPTLKLKHEGNVGNAYAVVTNMQETLYKEESLFRDNLLKSLCNNKDCLMCRVSFSFSDSKPFNYLMRQIAQLCKGRIKTSLANIKQLFYYTLYGQKQV